MSNYLKYIKREIYLNETLGTPISKDVKDMIDFFAYKKSYFEITGTTKTWFDEESNWTIDIDLSNNDYISYCHSQDSVIAEKLSDNSDESNDILFGMIEYTFDIKFKYLIPCH